jgi:Tol biopolymer transport system component
MKGRLALAVMPLALLAAAAVAAVLWKVGMSSEAAGSTPAGRLAFPAPSDAVAWGMPSDLFVIDADGAGRQRVAHCDDRASAASARIPFAGCILRAFAWSPDGERLAFVRGNMGGRDAGPNLSLFVTGADGEGERRLEGCGKPKWPSCGDFYGSQLAWDPDGSRLIVPRDGALYIFNVDRGGYRRLSPDCGARKCFDMHAAWSPDGSRIVFARQVAARSQALYSIRSDGSEMTRLTRLPGQAGNAVWSPNGRSIAFDFWDELHSRLYVMAADGSDLRVLRSGANATGPGVPAWSPSGTEIAYLVTPRAGTTFSAEIWVTKVNGSGRRRLYRSDYGLETWGRPVWSPDGKHLAFGVGLTSEPTSSGIYLVNADGTGLRRLVEAPTEPGWQPSP